MSRSNYDKPFYVDVGTSIAAIRCASDGDVIDWMDHHGQKDIIKIIEDKCDRLNQEAKQFYALDRIEAAWKREKAEVETLALSVGGMVEASRHKQVGNAAAKREKRLLKLCARWILTHDIYGNMAKELLAECKEVLQDDGRFLLPEEGAENGKV